MQESDDITQMNVETIEIVPTFDASSANKSSVEIHNTE